MKQLKLRWPENCNVILGTAHFIKTVEDIYEALVNAVPTIKFGVGFCEASGPCLVRTEGNNEELKKMAARACFEVELWSFLYYFSKRCVSNQCSRQNQASS